MIVSDQLFMRAQEAHMDVMDELKKESPDLNKVRVSTALVALAMVGISSTYLKKLEASSEHPCVDVEWEVMGECVESKEFCAAVALRRQSDELLSRIGLRSDDAEFQHQVKHCDIEKGN